MMNTMIPVRPVSWIPTWRIVRDASIALIAVLSLAACSNSKNAEFQGYVEGEFVRVASPVGGRLDHLAVRRGQAVAAGAPLFALDAVDEQAAQRQASGQLSAAEAQLADLNTGQRAPERGVAEAQLAQAKAAESLSAQQLKRDQEQFDIGGIPRSQLDEARAKHDIDAARVHELSNRLTIARLPARNDQIRVQSAQVGAARAALDQANWRLQQKQIDATQAGLVFDTLYREGEWVPPNSPIVVMLPPDNIKVRFFVPESFVGGLAVGRELLVRCDGCNEDVPATLSYVSPQPEYTPPIIYSNETRSKLVFLVEATPKNSAALQLKPGLPVRVLMQ